MSIFYLALAGLGIFLLLAFLRRWIDSFILIAFAIGAAVSANYYHAFSTPVYCGDLIFAIDSILFTLFMHTLVVKYLHYSEKEAKNMAIASLVAILLSAIFEFLGKIISAGYSAELLKYFIGYLLSALGSFVGIWTMFHFLKHTKKINVYIRIAIAILIGSIINSTIYYAGSILMGQSSLSSLWPILAGSYIGKGYSILLSLFIYFINGRIWYVTDHRVRVAHELEK